MSRPSQFQSWKTSATGINPFEAVSSTMRRSKSPSEKETNSWRKMAERCRKVKWCEVDRLNILRQEVEVVTLFVLQTFWLYALLCFESGFIETLRFEPSCIGGRTCEDHMYYIYIYYIHFLYFNIQSLQTLLSSLLPRIYCLILNQSPMCTALFLRCLSSPKIDSCSPYKSWALPMFNFFGGHLRSLIYRFWIILKPISCISLSGAKRRPCGLDTIRNGPLLG